MRDHYGGHGVDGSVLDSALEEAGMRVCLVNSQHVRHVSGRKSDVSDCQWLQYLHSVGLLKPSFRPDAAICALRSLNRHRSSLVESAAVHIQHMQKALTQMNLQIHHVLSDITGISGMAIIDAIVAGQRDPGQLASLCHAKVHSDRQTVIKSLTGNYRTEHLFTLKERDKACVSKPGDLHTLESEGIRSISGVWGAREQRNDAKGDTPPGEERVAAVRCTRRS